MGTPAAVHGCSPANQTWWSFGVSVTSSFKARSVTRMPRATVFEGVTYGTERTIRNPLRTSTSLPSSRRRWRSRLRAISLVDIQNHPVMHRRLLAVHQRTVLAVRVGVGDGEGDRVGRLLPRINQVNRLDIA